MLSKIFRTRHISIVTILFLIAGYVAHMNVVNQNRDSQIEKTAEKNDDQNTTIYRSETATSTASTTDQTVNSKYKYTLVRVVDGDTIVVKNSNGEEEKVRLIGINSPESVDLRRPVECFGKEASQYAKELLPVGIGLKLESDHTQDDLDKYKRLLRYVWTDTGLFFNKKMISDGYAYEYTYRLPYKYQKEFKAAQSIAQSSGTGLWATSTCDGLK